jgi:hypothetical protein
LVGRGNVSLVGGRATVHCKCVSSADGLGRVDRGV